MNDTDIERPEPEFEEPQDGTVRADAVVEEEGGLPEDNPFSEVVEDLRDEGENWKSIIDSLDEVYNVVDAAASEEMNVLMPDWKVAVVRDDVPNIDGVKYEYYERTAETAEEAEEMAERYTGYRTDPEKTEQVGVSKVF